MSKQNRIYRWAAWTAIIVLVLGTLATTLAYRMNRKTSDMPQGLAKGNQPPETDPTGEPQEPLPNIAVRVVHPKKGVLNRLSTQPGTVEAYESVRLVANVSGFLKKQTVDIGDRVRKGQVLAVVDVPELEAQFERTKAMLELSHARVDQMKARLKSAEADLKAAKAAVIQAEAVAESTAAKKRFRLLYKTRIKELVDSKSLELRLLEEAIENYEASAEAYHAAQAAIVTTNAQVEAGIAKIDQVKADHEEAEAQVKVAQADLKKTQVLLGYCTITAPFDGVITQRSLFEKDFVRSASDSSSNVPLLTVNRTDMMRVVVQIPDRDVPFTDEGDTAEVMIDALPEKKLIAKVSRIAKTENKTSRLMRVELDMPNPTGKICEGMYGQVTIVLDKERELVSLPSECVVQRDDEGMGKIYVVNNGYATVREVALGSDNGLRVGIRDGLSVDDLIIYQPGSAVSEGTQVTATLWDEVRAKKTASR